MTTYFCQWPQKWPGSKWPPGSGAVIQDYGSKDPDTKEIITYPQHWFWCFTGRDVDVQAILKKSATSAKIWRTLSNLEQGLNKTFPVGIALPYSTQVSCRYLWILKSRVLANCLGLNLGLVCGCSSFQKAKILHAFSTKSLSLNIKAKFICQPELFVVHACILLVWPDTIRWKAVNAFLYVSPR